MKIVINKLYGGRFDISIEVLKVLVDKKSEFVDKQTLQQFFGSEWQTLWLEIYKNFYDIDDGYKANSTNTLLYKDGYIFFVDTDNVALRTNELFIKTVDLFKNRANNAQSELVILNIPDDVKWEIVDFHGREAVREKHRVWF